jgi:hypothetical protein
LLTKYILFVGEIHAALFLCLRLCSEFARMPGGVHVWNEFLLDCAACPPYCYLRRFELVNKLVVKVRVCVDFCAAFLCACVSAVFCGSVCCVYLNICLSA